MPLYKIRFSTKGILDEMVINLDANDETEAIDVLVRFYKVDNPIIISMVQTDSASAKSYSSSYFDGGDEVVKTDPYAIITFCTGLLGFMILPIVFVPICYIFSLLSHYRLKENKNFKGKGLRLAGALLNTVNIIYLIYQFKSGVFDIYSF